MRIHHDRFPGDPLLDTAVSHALLRRVASGGAAESLRLYAPDDALLFSSLDARRPGYARAIEIARSARFEPVIRLAGGHAAVFLESAMAFAWATPDANAQQTIRPRFETLTRWVVATLERLGLDARVGALEGEYCPGEYSVNLAGRIKVMGVGQRVIRGGAHVGGVLTVGPGDALREILIPIYRALELEFRPETAGGLADLEPGLEVADVIAAFEAVLEEEGHPLDLIRFDDQISREAMQLAGHHAPERATRAAARLRPLDSSSGGKALLQSDSGDPQRAPTTGPGSPSSARSPSRKTRS